MCYGGSYRESPMAKGTVKDAGNDVQRDATDSDASRPRETKEAEA
jgi:hypothetical protein